MQGVEKFKVGDEEYEFRYLNPFQSADLLTRLLKKLLKPLGAAFGGKVKQAAGLLEQDSDIAGAFGALAENLDGETVAMLKELLSVVRHGTGMEIVQDEHFRGRILHMVKVAYKSFEYNYADFLAEKSVAQGILQRTMKQAFQTSTGSAGAQSSPELPRSLKSMSGGRSTT